MPKQIFTLAFLFLLGFTNAYAVTNTDGIELPPPYSHSGTVYMPPEPNVSIETGVNKTRNLSQNTQSKEPTTASLITETLI